MEQQKQNTSAAGIRRVLYFVSVIFVNEETCKDGDKHFTPPGA